MSQYQLDGSIFIDNFEFGIDYPIEDIKFVGINRALNISGSRPEAFPYKETVSGVLGLAPPQNEAAKNYHFLYQLKEKGVIDHLTFAIYLESDAIGRSDIKFGSYDTDRIEDGFQLSMIQTVNSTTWALQGKDFRIGNQTSEGTRSFLDETRKVFIEPSSPFIYVPPADFVKFARELQLSYLDQGLRCTYDNSQKSLSSSCRFEKPCD